MTKADETKPATTDDKANAKPVEEQKDGATSATVQAVPTEVSQDALNPAFASPEAQEEIRKQWQGEQGNKGTK